MKKFYVLVCLSLILSISSCLNEKKKINLNDCNNFKNNTYSFTKGKNISFKLDSLTPSNIQYVKFKTINDSVFYTFINHYTNTLYAYYYADKSFYKSIKLSSSRPITGYEIINWDKIITYAYKSNVLDLQSESGKIISSVNLPSNGQGIAYEQMPTTYSPIIYDGSNTYITGVQLTSKTVDKESKVITKINNSFTDKTYLYKYPELYNNYFFGGANYNFDISYTYNSKQKLFVFSFPASHKIYVTKDFSRSEEFCAGSRYVEFIPEYPQGMKEQEATKLFRYCSENGIYSGILYDQYNDLYYRLCLLPANNKEDEDYSRDLSVIILDSKFKVVGEKLFKDKIDFEIKYLNTITVSPEGLLIQQKNSFRDEDSLNFTIYNISKN
ncbi:DUF4221 family protein [Flavobacterium sp. LHD-85]|uniref:DUF4221 family protein n=1 Tax=Flavobacterium sp. LHD-85 TaxID=3071410 RepID=UPI0027E09690|nr:DUF4221 family protein [Flavobacterium sp. LHD-85]MDQ6527674.1 DUF4221 family protein [Flavobacterium sp. LHD-85]